MFNSFLGTENAYLKAWIVSQKDEEAAKVHSIGMLKFLNALTYLTQISAFSGREHFPLPLAESMDNSPRHLQLKAAGSRIFSSSGESRIPSVFCIYFC
jgi:hypothetical protein